MNDNDNGIGDKVVLDAAETANRGVENITFMVLDGLHQKGNNSTPEHLYVALTAAAAAVQIAAKLMTLPEEEPDQEWVQRGPEREAITVAALLIARCMIPNSTGFRMEYGAENIRAALEATKTLIGKANIEGIFAKKMIEAAMHYEPPTSFFDNSETVGGLPLNRTLN